MDTEMITVPARILNPPPITFQKIVSPIDGGWNLAGQKFNRASTIRGGFSCLQIRIIGREPQTKNFAGCFDKLCQQLKSYGIRIDNKLAPLPAVSIEFPDQENRDSIHQTLDNKFAAIANKKIKWLWISIPFHNAALYATLKTLGDTRYGIHTVIICDENAHKVLQKLPNGTPKADLGLIGNEALKFCAKSGGLSWAMDPKGLKLIGIDTMVIGIDVTHPSPKSQAGAPSIAAIVGSYDPQLSGWAADLRVQTPRVEMVEGLQSLLEGRLELFKKKNSGRLPANIIVYRDGVSEGQFNSVLNTEFPAMVRAFDQMYGKREQHPKVSIIVSSNFRQIAFVELLS
jgi:eukaryotic translation initiation factor 2C